MNRVGFLHYVYMTDMAVSFMKKFMAMSAQAHNKVMNTHESHEIETITHKFPHLMGILLSSRDRYIGVNYTHMCCVTHRQ
jgi:hypothetical protein